VPIVRPFRALRYDPETIGDVAAVISPPYDVVSPEQRERLAARHARNFVRIDLPREELGDPPDERYRRAAREFVAWRSDGTLRRDPRPSVYPYEQRYRLPGATAERRQRGFFARVRLEPPGPGSGVLAHERTLSAPREDRYRLLRATGACLSPIVLLYRDGGGRDAAALETLAAGAPAIDVSDDDGVRHRAWIVPADGPRAATVTALLEAVSAGPLTIADGHHRYETALRYRAERRAGTGSEEDPPFDYALALFFDTSTTPLTVLPTHRLVLGGSSGSATDELLACAREYFEVEPSTPEALTARFGPATQAAGGRFGLLTRAGAYLLTERPERIEPLLDPSLGRALRGLDVTRLQAALRPLFGIDPAVAEAGGRVGYTKEVAEARRAVESGEAVAAFLLAPTPVESVIAVAAEGDVMPQKSTYFHPKPASGLVIDPLES